MWVEFSSFHKTNIFKFQFELELMAIFEQVFRGLFGVPLVNKFYILHFFLYMCNCTRLYLPGALG